MYNRGIILILFFNVFILIGCQKDKINGNFTPLIGTWNYIISRSIYTNDTVILSESNKRTIEFFENGKYHVYVNGKKISFGKIINYDDYYLFHTGFFEKAKDDLTFKIFYPHNISNDTLYLNDSNPLPDESYTDIYVRE